MTLSKTKIWLIIWLAVSLVVMCMSLDTNTYKLFSYEKFFCNIFLFTPACSVLFFSVAFQWLNISLNKMFFSGVITIISYFSILIIFLPYSFLSCVLLGILSSPIGIFHYSVSVHFLGGFYEE